MTMRAITWTSVDPEPPLHGPIKPVACVDGWASHRWELTIEESNVVLITKCRLCTDGLNDFRDGEWPIEMSIPVAVTIDVINESYADNINVWAQLTPKEQPR